jgi:hypothetical protein
MRLLIPVAALLLCSVHPADAQQREGGSLAISLGAYAASGFGTNFYYGVAYDYHLPGGKYFIEASLGISSLHSAVLESVSKAQLFDSDRLVTYQFLVALDPAPSGPLPYLALGVAGINQGGLTRFAGVLGLGKKIPLNWSVGANQMALRYDLRDQIFSQQISNGETFVAHNIVFTVGIQMSL